MASATVHDGGGGVYRDPTAAAVEATAADAPVWFRDVRAAVAQRNARYALAAGKFEELMHGLEAAQKGCAVWKEEAREQKVKRQALARQLREGGGGTGAAATATPTATEQQLRQRVGALEDEQRKWMSDARVLIDLQAELRGLRAEYSRAAPFEAQAAAAQAALDERMRELAALQAAHEELEAAHARTAAENDRLLATAMEGKSREADQLNEITTLERQHVDALERIKVLEASVDVHTPVAPASAAAAASPTAAAAAAPPAPPAAPVAVPQVLVRGQQNCHIHGIHAIDASTVGGALATGAGDGLVKLWDAERLSLTDVLQGADTAVTRVRFSPRGDLLVAGTRSGTAVVWEVESPAYRVSATLAGHKAAVTGVCFDAHRTLFTCGGDRTIRRWDLGKGAGTNTNTAMSWSQCTDVAAGEMIVASAHADGQLRFWDSRTGATTEALKGVHTQAILSVCFAPDGYKLLSVGKEGVMKVHDVRAYRELMSMDLSRGGAPVAAVSKACFAADSNLVAVGVSTALDDAAVQVWDTRSRARLRATLRAGGGQALTEVTWANATGVLLTAGLDNAVLAWGVERT